MHSITLSLTGSIPDLEVLCRITTGDHRRVPGRAHLRLLVRSMEYTRRNGIQLHQLIWSPMDSTTHNNITPLPRNLIPILKRRTLLLPVLLLRTRPPCSSAENVPLPFQNSVITSTLFASTTHCKELIGYSKHIKKHYPPFQCDDCDKAFRYRKDLRRHCNSKHPATVDVLKVSFCRVYGCKYSTERSNGSSRSDNLRRHIRTQHGW
jgi:hypothetical protein